MEVSQLQKLWEKVAGRGIQFVAVHTGKTEIEAKDWMVKLGATFPAVQDDASFSIFMSYSPDSLVVPHNYIIGRGMVIAAEKVGVLAEDELKGHLILMPDSFEPNDTFEQALYVILSDCPEDSLKLVLSLHQSEDKPEDKDVFLIEYREILETFDGVTNLDLKWVEVSTYDGHLLIHASDPFDAETSFTFNLYDSQQTQKEKAEFVNDKKVYTPTELFPDRKVFVEVTSPVPVPLYNLEIALIEAGMSVRATRPLIEARWFEWPWEQVIFGDPAELVEKLINRLYHQSTQRELTPVENLQVADFQYQLGRLAETFELFNKAEELYLASSTRFEEGNDYESAVTVLRDLESLHAGKIRVIHSSIDRISQKIA